MPELIVTATGEVDGQTVSASAVAEVLGCPPPHRCGITETITVEVDASRLLDFTRLVERHAGELRRDLERFVHREHEHRDGWTGGGDRF